MATNRPARREKSTKESSNLVRGLGTYIRSQRFDDKAERQARNYRLMKKRALLYARAEVSPHNYGEWLDRFTAQQIVETNFLKKSPIGKENLLGIVPGPSVPLTSEIRWLAERLRRSCSEINGFLKNHQAFNRAVWGGRFADAIEILEHIEIKHGLTVWLINSRIAIEQIFNGVEGQKEYVTNIKSHFKRGLIPYLTHYISVRNEPSVSWAWYCEDMMRRVNQSRYDNVIKAYLKYHFTGIWPKSSSEIAKILKTEQSHSEIDVYETFIAFLQYATASNDYAGSATAIREALASLNHIEDPRLNKIRLVFGMAAEPQTFEATPSATELLKGRTSIAYRHALKSLIATPTAAHEAVVASFGRASTCGSGHLSHVSSIPPLWAEAIPDLAMLFRRGNQFAGALDRILKLSVNLGGTDCGRTIGAIAITESSQSAVPDQKQLRYVSTCFDKISYFEARAGINMRSSLNDLPSFFFLNDVSQDNYLHIDSSAALFAQAIRAAQNQNWGTVATLSDCAQESRHQGLKARANLLGMSARVRTEEVDTVVASIEKAIESDTISAGLLPHVAVVEGQNWSELRPSTHRMGLAITLDLALKATGDDKIATYRRFAFDGFLASQGVDRASKLPTEKYSNKTLTYLLRNVAVPSVLDMSDALESSKEIQEERRSILSILTGLDPENAATYQDEILEISDALEVAEGLKIVDSSRIHVDNDVIEAWANRELSDNYHRYRVLLQTGIGVAKDFDEFLAGLRRIDERGKNQFAIPDNEADELLVSIIRQLLYEFLYDPAHGLDSYLSRRIRHGSIVGFLRGPVEEGRLVTLRDEGDNSYAKNTHWLEALADLDEEEQALVSSALHRFAKSYDDAIIELRDDLLQLRDKDHPKGLFDMKLFADQYHLIRSAIKDNDNFSIFISACFASFWGILDRSLQSVRSYITKDLRSALGAAFENLRATVNELHQVNIDLLMGPPAVREGLGELNSAITFAQNNLQGALEDVATWFIRSETQLAKRSYTLQESANIAKASALARLRHYSPSITMTIAEDWAVPSSDLSTIADIMLIGLGNACEHSGLIGDTPIDVSIERNSEAGQLVFKFSNPVAKEARTPAKTAMLEAILTEVSSGSITDVVRKDRRSGLRKLGAMSAMNTNASLEFGFTNHATFELILALPLVTIYRVASDGEKI